VEAHLVIYIFPYFQGKNYYIVQGYHFYKERNTFVCKNNKSKSENDFCAGSLIILANLF